VQFGANSLMIQVEIYECHVLKNNVYLLWCA